MGVFWYPAPVANVSPNDAPSALIMGAGFLAFGLTMILRPSYVRANLDRFADSWKQGSWHPYKMPDWGLRIAGMDCNRSGYALFLHRLSRSTSIVKPVPVSPSRCYTLSLQSEFFRNLLVNRAAEFYCAG